MDGYGIDISICSRLIQVFGAGLRGFLYHNLDAVVADLGSGVFLAAADSFALSRNVLDALLTSATSKSACWSAVRSLLLTVHYQ